MMVQSTTRGLQSVLRRSLFLEKVSLHLVLLTFSFLSSLDQRGCASFSLNVISLLCPLALHFERDSLVSVRAQSCQHTVHGTARRNNVVSQSN